MRLFYTLLVFGIALQMSTYLLWAFNVDPQMNYPLGNIDNIATTFSLSPFNIAFTAIGATVIGLAGLLLKVGTYAYYAVLIWVIGTLLPITQGFFLAIPNSIGVLIPAGANSAPIMTVIGAIFAFAAFFFFVELAAQRQIT